MSETKQTTPGDGTKISVFVAVAPADAFEVFTQEVDLWWQRGVKYRISGRKPGVLTFEPGVGGRLFETVQLSTRAQVFETGRITAWEPPSLLAFEWRGVNYKAHEKTFVEVRFKPQNEGTLVTVHHYGFNGLPSDHPARHGQQGTAFSRRMGLWWSEIMTSLREHVATTRGSTGLDADS